MASPRPLFVLSELRPCRSRYTPVAPLPPPRIRPSVEYQDKDEHDHILTTFIEYYVASEKITSAYHWRANQMNHLEYTVDTWYTQEKQKRKVSIDDLVRMIKRFVKQ